MSSKDYKSSGVDVDQADAWVADIAGRLGAAGDAQLRGRLRSGVGDYAAVYALTDDNWLALSCDGVGTKLLWTKEGFGTVDALAQDLVAMNANDVLCVGARPLLFLDYLAVGSLQVVREGGLKGFIGGLSKACAESGMIVVGGETAQMPDVYGREGYDLAGFAAGVLQPREHLTVERVQPGAEVWGWSSNGPHSNGFSWLRKVFDSARDGEFIRRELMAPTRLYAKDFLGLRDQLRSLGREDALQSAFHITGSGVLNFLRAQPKGRTIGVDLTDWPDVRELPWVRELVARTGTELESLWRTFNMGFGFCVVLDRDLVRDAKSLLESLGLRRLGCVTSDPIVRVGGLELR
jgi:phosphoribosylformylglycinamidine cyclo-ligase